MKNKRAVKGQYEYIKRQKQMTTLRTLLMFTMSLSIFLFGMWYFGTKKNFCTVIAILGCLPASKSAVNMIMFLKARGCTAQAKAAVQPYIGELTQLYDMYFTSYEKNYQISHMVFGGNVICGYSEDPKCDEKACEKHLDTILKQGGCKKTAVKIYKDLEKYCEGINNLTGANALPENQTDAAASVENENDFKQQEEITANLFAVSL